MATSAIQRFLVLALLGAVAFGVSGCREAERGRILMYEQGVYLGKADTPLDAEQERLLSSHTMRQGAW